MMDEMTYVSQIVTQIQEETDAFILETIQPFCEYTMKCELSKDDLRRACTLLLAERSGQIEARKTGKWEYHNLFRTCSACGATTGEKDDFNDWIPDKYCPNCGARMEVDE